MVIYCTKSLSIDKSLALKNVMLKILNKNNNRYNNNCLRVFKRKTQFTQTSTIQLIIMIDHYCFVLKRRVLAVI